MKFDTNSPWGNWKPKGIAAVCLDIIDRLPVNGFCRKLAFLLRKPVKNSSQNVFDREIWGLRLRLASRGNLTEQRWLTMANFHDAPERAALAAALKPGSVFLDIGANAGFYSFWALSGNHEGLRVVSIEPTEVMRERMQYNLAENGLESSVLLFPCAVTPEACEVFIDEHEGNIGQTAVRTEGSGRKVAGRPLLEILREASVEQVDAMKIDIEGFEVPVLEAFFASAPKTLWPRFVIGEIVGEGGESLKDLLVSKGYRLDSSTKMNGMLSLRA
jgi:FkbM family methyltransferase